MSGEENIHLTYSPEVIPPEHLLQSDEDLSSREDKCTATAWK